MACDWGSWDAEAGDEAETSQCPGPASSLREDRGRARPGRGHKHCLVLTMCNISISDKTNKRAGANVYREFIYLIGRHLNEKRDSVIMNTIENKLEIKY